MKTRIVVICMVALSLVVFIPQASACSCIEPNIENSFAEADNLIFSGTVSGIKEQQRTYLVTFEIDQSWKGIPDDITDIITMTAQSSATCGYNFEDKKRYLVEAHGKWDQTPEVSICSSTTLLDFAHEQISFLNKQLLENVDERDFTFLDTVIISSPDYDIETAFKVTTLDDCHGESRYGESWEWIDEECIVADPPPDSKIIPHKYIFASPLKQIKAGVALVDIQCNDGKNVVYKHDRMRAACVTQETEGKLIFERGWATMRLGLPATDDYGRDLCSWYGGEWDNLPRQCHGLKYPLLCSMSGGDVIDGACFIPSTTGVAPVEPIRQNDFNCFTYWDATISSDVEHTTLEVMLRDEIAKFGTEYDFNTREIKIENIGENRVQIGVQGCWGWPESFEPDLQLEIGELEHVKEIK